MFLKQPTKEEIWSFKDSLNRGLSYTLFKYLAHCFLNVPVPVAIAIVGS